MVTKCSNCLSPKRKKNLSLPLDCQQFYSCHSPGIYIIFFPLLLFGTHVPYQKIYGTCYLLLTTSDQDDRQTNVLWHDATHKVPRS